MAFAFCDEMPYDHGFDLPDVRERYVLKNGRIVTIEIVRDWYHDENEVLDFHVQWAIKENGSQEYLLREDDQDKARRIMKAMYSRKIDWNATRAERYDRYERYC